MWVVKQFNETSAEQSCLLFMQRAVGSVPEPVRRNGRFALWASGVPRARATRRRRPRNFSVLAAVTRTFPYGAPMSLAPALRSQFQQLAGPPPMREFSDYDAYWDRRGVMPRVMERWRIAADSIPDGSTVLDVGCGSGEFLAYLKSRRPNVRAVGADFPSVAVAKTRANGVDAFRLEVPGQPIEQRYDVITCFEVLEHIPEAEQALRQLGAAAADRLILSIPNVGYYKSRMRLAVFGRFPVTNCVYHVKEHVRHWTVRDFQHWTAALGFRVTGYRAQYRSPRLPAARFPSLLCKGILYFVEPAP